MRRAVAAAAVIFAVFALLAIVTANEAMAAGCPSVQRYAVGGNGDTQSRGVRAPYPRMNITYPADVSRGDYSRRVAREKLDREGHAMRARCPGTKIEVYAYSLGASAASTAVDYWQTDARMNHNTEAWFYGNPRRPGTRSEGGIETVGLPNIPGVYTWLGPHHWGRIPVHEICHVGNDGVCSTPKPFYVNPVGVAVAWNGYANGGHGY